MNLRTHARKGRLHPRGWRSYALGGAAVAVLLASTACEPGGDDGVPMPVDTLYADDGQLVTYWTTASGYALDFIMSK
ncbi:hypothetical protein ACFU98_00535 [Streptomyces sp. NPDC057575]|uniref:hypothetical protein n=1 Tax=unclassified Streptomyces TaxID=2593676 RepID=UPI00369EB36B